MWTWIWNYSKLWNVTAQIHLHLFSFKFARIYISTWTDNLIDFCKTVTTFKLIDFAQNSSQQRSHWHILSCTLDRKEIAILCPFCRRHFFLITFTVSFSVTQSRFTAQFVLRLICLFSFFNYSYNVKSIKIRNTKFEYFTVFLILTK